MKKKFYYFMPMVNLIDSYDRVGHTKIQKKFKNLKKYFKI